MISQELQKIIENDKEYLFQNYGDRLPVSFVRGVESFLFDQDNKRYIDFFSGIAVCSLGYSNKDYSQSLHKQIDNIIHSSNWFFNSEQIEAAKLISELAFKGKTLFVNSGTEANEAAIKLVRRYGQSIDKERYHIISFKGSFHGRTFGSMSATAQDKIQRGFGPLVPGFRFLPFNDIEEFEKEIINNNNICAVITELIHGEGGIVLAQKEFIKKLFNLCKKKDIITIVDEVQTGIGRTGKPFVYQGYDIIPDILTLAKGLGGGIPIGAIHTRDELSRYLNPGSHGTTFGGNHLSCTAAISVLKEFKKGDIFKNIEKINNYIFTELNKIKNKVTFINEVRGLGLHIGIELKKEGIEIVKKALQQGLIINCTDKRVLRIMPPLSISLPIVKEGIKILEKIFLEEGE